MEFKVISICGKDSRYYGANCVWDINVTVTIDAKVWTKYRDKGALGSLYMDVSNHVYSLNQDIPAHNPTVDHGSRAKNGLKTIRLTYRLSNPERAERIGFKVMRLKSGEVISGYNDFVNILEKLNSNVIQLRSAK